MKETIFDLIKEATWSNKIARLITSLSAGASITGITMQTWKFDYSEYFDWKCILLVCFSIFSIRVLWICAKNLEETKVAKRPTYTAHKLIKNVKDIVKLINKFINEEIKQEEVLAELCNKLRDCMDKLTNSHCCVSIKLIEGGDDGNFTMPLSTVLNQRVRNVARDSKHYDRDSEPYKKAIHLISSNTAYETIIGKLQSKKQVAFYRNNDVSTKTDYLTSSPYEDDEIPYRSELVFGILKQADADSVVLKGFICIDSEEVDAFKSDQIMLDLTEMIADSLYWILTFTSNK
jgi:hypothetical protein